jgi:glycosyltransferase involved in cell wall biosynthesis
MIGTRGVPAAYGGFETAVEEIGGRLAENGHLVTVYCRSGAGARPRAHRGMRLVHLPAVHSKFSETLSHTGLSIAHLAATRRPDVAFVFNAANAPFLPALRAMEIPVALHMDGLEWKRAKWTGAGRRYYQWAERFAVRWADALIADAHGIADYYERTFRAPTELLTYGAKIIEDPSSDRLSELGLAPYAYHLVVARFEPENNVDLIVEGYTRSGARHPLVVVGNAPYAAAYTGRIAELAGADPRVRLVGGVWDQELLDQIYANAATYLHGHSVGGTNPSLLRAMGAATPVGAFDVGFNREVLGGDGAFFAGAESLRLLVEAAEAEPELQVRRGLRLQERARNDYDWDSVARGYEDLGIRLAAGHSIHHSTVPSRRQFVRS